MIISSLGGNCRLLSYVPLKGKGLKAVRGQNSNPFYQVPETVKPLIHSGNAITPLSLRKIYEYDIATREGSIVEISKM